MSNLRIEQLPAPAACGLCGRPTTRYSPELRVAYCGREERPAGVGATTGEVAPSQRGGEPRRGRRGLRRRGQRRPSDG